MPAEPMTLLLRPRNFFERNPALDVPPSMCVRPSEVRKRKEREAEGVVATTEGATLGGESKRGCH